MIGSDWDQIYEKSTFVYIFICVYENLVLKVAFGSLAFKKTDG